MKVSPETDFGELLIDSPEDLASVSDAEASISVENDSSRPALFRVTELPPWCTCVSDRVSVPPGGTGEIMLRLIPEELIPGTLEATCAVTEASNLLRRTEHVLLRANVKYLSGFPSIATEVVYRTDDLMRISIEIANAGGRSLRCRILDPFSKSANNWLLAPAHEDQEGEAQQISLQRWVRNDSRREISITTDCINEKLRRVSISASALAAEQTGLPASLPIVADDRWHDIDAKFRLPRRLELTFAGAIADLCTARYRGGKVQVRAHADELKDAVHGELQLRHPQLFQSINLVVFPNV